MGRYISLIEDDVLHTMSSYVEREGYLPAHLAFMLLKEIGNLKAEIRRLEDERDGKAPETQPVNPDRSDT